MNERQHTRERLGTFVVPIITVAVVAVVGLGVWMASPPNVVENTEYVIVNYVESRSVLIDGVQNGRTGEKLRLSSGPHRFSLGGAQDYKPLSRVTVENTSAIAPMRITFEKQ